MVKVLYQDLLDLLTITYIDYFDISHSIVKRVCLTAEFHYKLELKVSLTFTGGTFLIMAEHLSQSELDYPFKLLEYFNGFRISKVCVL